MRTSSVWVDGALRPADRPVVRADDSAYSESRGCYTAVRVCAGAPRFAERHVRRLLRDAHALGLPPADPHLLRRALRELAAGFSGGEGIVRLQLSRDGDGSLHVVGVPRDLGDDPAAWTAVTAPFPHPGAPLAGGPKLTHRLLPALALDAARASGADEALLFDVAGRLVEGARTNIVALGRDGEICTPPTERGAVAGVALEVAGERLPALSRRDLSRRDLLAARGVAAINAVRGARALVALDGAPLGAEGEALAGRLAAVLEDD
ncbi:MAG TPA: aminotransferase class IV [Myxococcota bacterium]|nr:aminotransferase class IV [Myxococcota bacterium]